MKQIRCRRCQKTVQVEDYYGLKTCPICHEKDRGYSRVKSEKRKQNRSSVELVENLKFTEPLPKFLQNFSEFQTYWKRFDKEVTFEDYIKELNEHKKREIQNQTDTQVSKTKGQFQAKKRFLMKFLRFEIWEPSNRNDCSKFRLQKLGLYHEEPNWLNEHMELCEECKLWLDNLMNDVLDSQDGLFIHLGYAEDFKSEEDFRKVIKKCRDHNVEGVVMSIDEKLKKITVVCNPNSFVPQIDNSFEARLERMHDICPVCGTPLINGKCPNCG